MLRSVPSDRNYPQFPEESDRITHPKASIKRVKFNRWGSLVAISGEDGSVFIYDYRARSFVLVRLATHRQLQWKPHALPVSSLSWSRDGRQLLTSSADKTVVVSDVVTGEEVVSRVVVGSFVVSAKFNPRNDDQCLIMTTSTPPMVHQFSSKCSTNLVDNVARRRDECVSAVSYDKRGTFIFAGTSKGRIFIYDATTNHLLTWCCQSSTSQIKQIVMPLGGGFFITNSMDRIIRVYKFDNPSDVTSGLMLTPLKILQDSVNRIAWINICCDKFGEYICGVSTEDYMLYIWERASGTLVKILHGPKGHLVLDVQWHPTLPVILTVSDGGVTVWSPPGVENWSAFAPEFKELEENEKYAEKEGEFDLEDEDASEDEKHNNTHDEEIDVVGFQRDDLLCSSDEDLSELVPNATMTTGPLWYIPRAPEMGDPDEPEIEEVLPKFCGVSIQQQLEAISLREVRMKKKRGKFIRRRGKIMRRAV